MLNDNVVVNYSADVSNYNASLQQAIQITEQFGNVSGTAAGKIASLGSTMTSGLLRATTKFTAQSGMAVSQAAAYQQALSSLAATAATSGQSFERISDSTRKLARDFPVGISGAVEMVRTLQAVGAKANDIDKLAVSFTKLGAAVGESAAPLGAQVSNYSKAFNDFTPDRVSKVSDSITMLSNTFGAPAGQTTELASALAPFTRTAGMSSTATLGVAAAFTKEGEGGFAAANAFSKMLADITSAVKEGTPILSNYADVVGMTSKEFKTLFQNDPARALTELTKQLGKDDSQTLWKLNALGLDGVRTQKTLVRLAQTGGLEEAMSTSLQGYGNGSTEKGSAAAYGGVNDALTKLGETSSQIVANLGQPFLKVTELIVNAGSTLAGGFERLTRVLPIQQLTAFAGAIGKVWGLFATVGLMRMATSFGPVKNFMGATRMSAMGITREMLDTVAGREMAKEKVDGTRFMSKRAKARAYDTIDRGRGTLGYDLGMGFGGIFDWMRKESRDARKNGKGTSWLDKLATTLEVSGGFLFTDFNEMKRDRTYQRDKRRERQNTGDPWANLGAKMGNIPHPLNPFSWFRSGVRETYDERQDRMMRAKKSAKEKAIAEGLPGEKVARAGWRAYFNEGKKDAQGNLLSPGQRMMRTGWDAMTTSWQAKGDMLGALGSKLWGATKLAGGALLGTLPGLATMGISGGVSAVIANWQRNQQDKELAKTYSKDIYRLSNDYANATGLAGKGVIAFGAAAKDASQMITSANRTMKQATTLTDQERAEVSKAGYQQEFFFKNKVYSGDDEQIDQVAARAVAVAGGDTRLTARVVQDVYKQASVNGWAPEAVDQVLKRIEAMSSGAGMSGLPNGKSLNPLLMAMSKSSSDQVLSFLPWLGASETTNQISEQYFGQLSQQLTEVQERLGPKAQKAYFASKYGADGEALKDLQNVDGRALDKFEKDLNLVAGSVSPDFAEAGTALKLIAEEVKEQERRSTSAGPTNNFQSGGKTISMAEAQRSVYEAVEAKGGLAQLQKEIDAGKGGETWLDKNSVQMFNGLTVQQMSAIYRIQATQEEAKAAGGWANTGMTEEGMKTFVDAIQKAEGQKDSSEPGGDFLNPLAKEIIGLSDKMVETGTSAEDLAAKLKENGVVVTDAQKKMLKVMGSGMNDPVAIDRAGEALFKSLKKQGYSESAIKGVASDVYLSGSSMSWQSILGKTLLTEAERQEFINSPARNEQTNWRSAENRWLQYKNMTGLNEEQVQARQSAREGYTQSLQSKQQRRREFVEDMIGLGVQQSRANTQFGMSQRYAQEDYDTTKVRAAEQYEVQISRMVEQYQRTRKWGEKDWQRQMRIQDREYHIARKEQAEQYQITMSRSYRDFNKQMKRMAEDGAAQMLSPYERLYYNPVMSGKAMQQNLKDQAESMREQLRNIESLKSQGLDSRAIDLFGLADPKMARQVAQWMADAVTDPALISELNGAVAERIDLSSAFVKESKEGKRGLEDFMTGVKDSGEDYERSRRIQRKQYQRQREEAERQHIIDLRRMKKEFDIVLKQAAEDYERQLRIMLEEFSKQQARSQEQFSLSMSYMVQDVENKYDQLFGNMNDRAKKANDVLQKNSDSFQGKFKKQVTDLFGVTLQEYDKFLKRWAKKSEAGMTTPKIRQDGSGGGGSTRTASQIGFVPFTSGGPSAALSTTIKDENGQSVLTRYADPNASKKDRKKAIRSIDAANELANWFDAAAENNVRSINGASVEGACLQNVSVLWERITGYRNGTPSATAQAKRIADRGAMHGTGAAPRGALYWWTGAYGMGKGYGHVAVADGRGNAVNNYDSTVIQKNAVGLMNPGSYMGWSYAEALRLAKGGIATGPTNALIAEAGYSEAVIPLNKQGVDYLTEAMRAFATPDDVRCARTRPYAAPVSNVYHQSYDHSTRITGPITVQSNDPNEMADKLRRKQRHEALTRRVGTR